MYLLFHGWQRESERRGTRWNTLGKFARPCLSFSMGMAHAACPSTYMQVQEKSVILTRRIQPTYHPTSKCTGQWTRYIYIFIIRRNRLQVVRNIHKIIRKYCSMSSKPYFYVIQDRKWKNIYIYIHMIRMWGIPGRVRWWAGLLKTTQGKNQGRGIQTIDCGLDLGEWRSFWAHPSFYFKIPRISLYWNFE